MSDVLDLAELAAADHDARFLHAARPFWHPIARSKELDPGGVAPVTLLGEQLVLWRARDGRLGLVDDLCVHRGTRLSLGDVTDTGCIRCPYHAWEFGGDGACARIPQLPDGPVPAKARTRAFRTDEHAGLIWACLVDDGEPARGRPEFPEANEAGRHLYVGEVMDWQCQSTRQIENFLDIAHFSVTHVDVFGNPDVMEVPPHRIERDGWQLRTQLVYPGLNPLEPPEPGGTRPVHPIEFRYRVELPFAVHLASTMADLPYVLFVANQPVTAATCKLYWVMVIAEGVGFPDELIEASEQIVFHADRRIVETQRPERLPLDLGAELHLPFDRFAVAYRRALAELGFPAASATASTASR